MDTTEICEQCGRTIRSPWTTRTAETVGTILAIVIAITITALALAVIIYRAAPYLL